MNDLKEKFLTLLEEHQGIVHHICTLYTHDKDDHKDLFQEIVFHLWKSFASFQHQSKFSTWLYRVALNTAISQLRKNKKMSYTNLEEAENISMEPTENIDEEIQLMYEAIRKLSKIDRAITMLYLNEHKYEEIAEILGIAASNVGVRINRVKAKLEKMMKQV